MSFIDKSSAVEIRVKLTSIGRKLLASGALTFDKWAIGDSEVDYNMLLNHGILPNYNNILTPFDLNPPIKYRIPKSVTDDGFVLIDSSNFTASEKLLNNVAKERGFFTGTVLSGFTAQTSTVFSVQADVQVNQADITGSNIFQLSQSASYGSNKLEPIAGDYILINWLPPGITSAPPKGIINKYQQTGYLWYKIQSTIGSLSANTLTLVVDRPIPNFNGSATVPSRAIVYPGKDAIDNYYTPLSGASCFQQQDVPVWNMNIVHTEDIAGFSGSTIEYFNAFGSSGYTGFKAYINDTVENTNQKCLGIIHYSNQITTNEYGEGLRDNTPVLEIPTIMWYKSTGNTIGITLKCGTVKKLLTFNSVTNSNTLYYDLYIDNDPQKTIIGKCFPNLKLFVIEDEELIAAMTYKSNRNWTLPPLELSILDLNTSSETNLINNTTETVYVTYLFQNDQTGYVAGKSNGLKTALPCQYYTKITSTESVLTRGVPVVDFKYKPTYLSPTTGLNNGTGYTATKVLMLVQKVANSSSRPLPDQWRTIDITSQLPNSSLAINSDDLIPSKTFRIDGTTYASAPLFNLGDYMKLTGIAEPDTLQFGDEVYFYGNVKTSIQAKVYRSDVVIIGMPNDFKTSNNPTWSVGQSIYITEAGVYNTNDDLVAIAKLNSPVEKKQTGGFVLFNLSIDF